MIVDANIYWLPTKLFEDTSLLNKFLRCVPRQYGIKAYVEDSNNKETNIVIEKPVGYPSLNYASDDYTLENQLRNMDEAQVTHGILKLPGCQEWIDLDLCKMFNDELSKHVKRSDGRLQGLAVVPPNGDEECLYELERAVKELGFSGVQISAHYGDIYLDNEMFRPFFKKINELNIPVYVHHTPTPVEYESIFEYNNLRRSLGRCIDQSVAVGREIFSDMFAEFPNLKLVHSMLGGGFFSVKNLLFPNTGGQGRFDSNNDYEKYLKNNIYFETSHAQPWGKEQLECAVKVLGANKIIYGSSYPVKDVWLYQGANFINSLEISNEDKELILSKNAKEIYRIS